MNNYRYNALDIAAYLKWSTVPALAEKKLFSQLFQLRELILARPISKDVASFTQFIYKDMYHLWSRGFENELSDISLITENSTIALICEPDFLLLESYLKLLTLHLILSENLPYIRINFTGLPLLVGFPSDYDDYNRNLEIGFSALGICLKTLDNQLYPIEQGIPDYSLCLALKDSFRCKMLEYLDPNYKINKFYQKSMFFLQEDTTISSASPEGKALEIKQEVLENGDSNLASSAPKMSFAEFEALVDQAEAEAKKSQDKVVKKNQKKSKQAEEPKNIPLKQPLNYDTKSVIDDIDDIDNTNTNQDISNISDPPLKSGIVLPKSDALSDLESETTSLSLDTKLQARSIASKSKHSKRASTKNTSTGQTDSSVVVSAPKSSSKPRASAGTKAENIDLSFQQLEKRNKTYAKKSNSKPKSNRGKPKPD